jgi:hypothetical protein
MSNKESVRTSVRWTEHEDNLILQTLSQHGVLPGDRLTEGELNALHLEHMLPGRTPKAIFNRYHKFLFQLQPVKPPSMIRTTTASTHDFPVVDFFSWEYFEDDVLFQIIA